MPLYRVISFDLFMTLADLDARVPVLWERIFTRPLLPEEVARHAAGLRSHYLPYYHALYEPPFVSMGAVFRRGFCEYFSAAGIDADPDRAADIFLEEHNYCPIYEDARALLKRLEGRYRIVLSTDADVSMVRGLLPLIPHEAAYISEELGVYKANREGAFFRHVLDKTGVQPSEILHVGDGRSDIIGAKLCGIDVYHVEREGGGLPEGLRDAPDFTGRGLEGLYEILNV